MISPSHPLHIESVTPALAELMEDAAWRRHPLLVTSPANSKLAPATRRAAQTLTECCAISAQNSATLRRSAEVLPVPLFTVLILICGLRYRLERVESALGLPARSARALAVIALDDLIRRGVV